MNFERIFYWENPVRTGLIFGTVLVTLMSICYFSLISVVAYLCLALLLTVVGLKLYVYVMVTFLKKETANPIVNLSECKVNLPSDKVQEYARRSTDKLNGILVELRRLFLIENMMDSLKFGLSLWLLTYIGSWFNAMTIIIMAWVALFTIPKVYLNNQAHIDPVLAKVKGHFIEIYSKVIALMPHAKPVVEAKKEE